MTPTMTRDQLARRIAEVSLLRGEFTLRSGRKSNYYLDKYRFETQGDVLAALGQLRERHRFMKGLFGWVGFNRIAIPYERQPRSAGHSKYNVWKLWNFALEGVTSFSTAPLRVATYAGLVTALLAFGYGVWIVFKALLYGDAVQGWPTMMAVILFLGGTQLMALGLIGEYLGRLYLESKQRPLYLVDTWLPAEGVQSGQTLSSGGVHDAYRQASAGGEGA